MYKGPGRQLNMENPGPKVIGGKTIGRIITIRMVNDKMATVTGN